MRLRRIPSLLLAGTLWCGLLLAPARSNAASRMQTYVDAMQPGWNLGNSLDATPGETSWGNPRVTKKLIRQIAAEGFKSIRVPVTWTHHTGAAPDYKVDPAWMARVQQIVDWSLEAGLYVMINVHHDSRNWTNTMPANRTAVVVRYRALWTQIAARFRDYPDRLMFESINEPAFDGVDESAQLALLDELNVLFFHLVRDSGGANATRPLVLPTLKAGGDQPYLDSLNATIARLADPNLIATIHYYGYWPFSVNVAGTTTFDAKSIADLKKHVDTAYAAFVARGIPVVIGEYGLLCFDKDTTGSAVERGEMLKFFELYTHYAREKKFAHMWWDNGQHFDRATGRWRDPELFGIIKQSLMGRTSSAATDLIFLPSAAASDVTLELNLNGNTFVALDDGAAPLVAGTDYALDGSQLTIKAGALARYASGAYGEKALLTARFSTGSPWKVHVRHVAPPQLKAAKLDRRGALKTPVAFNGDLLATIEAVYVDGGNAGPNDFTAFKEYGAAFAPDYAKGAVTITKKFFEATTAGKAIDFTFHFRSGRSVKYRFSGSRGVPAK
jgi:aryl-phospho-beta-D-glucosidase BglC (GH1 family)